jgi:8-oxo-dGTP pyrophosphatase MutT (NUDIX family)
LAVPPPPRQGPGAQPPPAAALVRPPVDDLATRPRVFATLNGADRRNARSVRFAAHLPAPDHAGADANDANDANDPATPAASVEDGPDATAAPRTVAFAAAAENLDAARRSLARAQRRAASLLHHNSLAGFGPRHPAAAALAEAEHDVLDVGVDANGDFSGASVFVVCQHGALMGCAGGIWQDFGGRRDGNETPYETAFRELKEEIGLTASHVDLLPDQPVWVCHAGYRHAVFVATLSEANRLRSDWDLGDEEAPELDSYRNNFVDFANFFADDMFGTEFVHRRIKTREIFDLASAAYFDMRRAAHRARAAAAAASSDSDDDDDVDDSPPTPPHQPPDDDDAGDSPPALPQQLPADLPDLEAPSDDEGDDDSDGGGAPSVAVATAPSAPRNARGFAPPVPTGALARVRFAPSPAAPARATAAQAQLDARVAQRARHSAPFGAGTSVAAAGAASAPAAPSVAAAAPPSRKRRSASTADAFFADPRGNAASCVVSPRRLPVLGDTTRRSPSDHVGCPPLVRRPFVVAQGAPPPSQGGHHASALPPWRFPQLARIH